MDILNKLLKYALPIAAGYGAYLFGNEARALFQVNHIAAAACGLCSLGCFVALVELAVKLKNDVVK